MTFKLGLTGSIGMGKSTTARFFEEEGCAVWDADAAVHRLYAQGGAAVEPLGKLFPTARVDGAIDRSALKRIIQDDPGALAKIERIVHPLVAADRQHFIAATEEDIVVLDIPLLFETGSEKDMDAVVCVTADPDVQRERALARGTMTSDQFEHILSKQMPNGTKCDRSDFVVETKTRPQARAQVRHIVRQIREKMDHA
jgi:dephospho-CoA kinase